MRTGTCSLVVAAFVGPGTVLTCASAGVDFGYALGWVLVFSDEHGLSLDHMQDVIASSPVGAPLLEYKGPSWRTATSRSNSPSTSY